MQNALPAAKISSSKLWQLSILVLLFFALSFYGFSLYNARAFTWVLVIFWLCIFFQFWQLIGFLHTIWYLAPRDEPLLDPLFLPKVDVFITVAGEPLSVIESTV